MKNKKMKTCKSCGAEVAKSAKTCPKCGAKLKRGHPILIGVLVFFILVGIIGALGSSDEPQKVDDSQKGQNIETIQSDETIQSEDKKEIKQKSTFTVGETVELNDVNVTLVDVVSNTGSDFNKPAEGNVFLICEFDIENNSKSDIAVSSMMSFEAYCDDYACNLSLGAMMEKGNKNQLDGTVAAGKKMNGIVGYEASADWQEFEIVFTPNFWNGKNITFVTNNQ